MQPKPRPSLTIPAYSPPPPPLSSTPESALHPRIILGPETPRQLLIPQFDRPLARLAASAVHVKAKHHKLIRSHKTRSHELLSAVAQSPAESRPISVFAQFHTLPDTKRLAGFQCYVVEKWLVERDLVRHPLTTITTLTNDEKDVVEFVVLVPPSTSSPANAERELQDVMYCLKRNGARSHETTDGIVMTTSLDTFRGDLNLIPIPDGDWDTQRSQMFANINLARMGCAGRSIPSLDPTPVSVQEKFLAQYAIPGSVAALVGFNTLVLEFVRLVQAALVIFGMFPTEVDRDGLLCDLTIRGMQHWLNVIGEPYFQLEPMVAVLEPTAVATMLSLVSAFRWRIYTLGASAIPKDPFYDPESALAALTAFQKSQLQREPTPYLSLSLLKEINSIYQTKSESYRVPKAIMHRPEDSEFKITSVEQLKQDIVDAGKDGVQSLRLVWAGKTRKERKKEREGEKDTAGESDEVSEQIGRMLRRGAGNVHALVGGVKGGVKELGGLARSRKDTDKDTDAPLPTFKFTLSDPEQETDATPVPHSTRSSFLGLPSSSTSDISHTNYSAFPLFNPNSNDSFDPMMSSQTTGSIEMRPVFRRIQTIANHTPIKQDKDEMSPVDRSRLRHRDLSEPATANRNVRRRWSLDDLEAFGDSDRVPEERMQIDVELCGQYLELRDKEIKLKHAITIAQVTLAAVQRTNTHLERELTAHRQALETLVPRSKQLHEDARSYLGEATEISKTSEMLEYQLDRLEEGVKDMSRSVAGGRNRVRALRGEARRVGGVYGLEEDSNSDDGDDTGANAKQGVIQGMQSMPGMRRLGAWLGAARVRAERPRQ